MVKTNLPHAVIKFGGHALDNAEIKAAFLEDLLDLQKRQLKTVLVHGGGPNINRLLKRLGIEGEFKNGLRVTSPETLEVVEMALCGQANKELARLLLKAGINAAGISGEDGNTLRAVELDPSLGRVGKITSVNPALILALLEKGFLPVVAPLALDENEHPLNVNADTAAAHIAGALGAPWFILISDVPGVKNAEWQTMPSLSVAEINEMKKSGVIHGGMIPKVDACLHALAHGCKTTLILDASQKNSLSQTLRDGKICGTVIVN